MSCRQDFRHEVQVSDSQSTNSSVDDAKKAARSAPSAQHKGHSNGHGASLHGLMPEISNITHQNKAPVLLLVKCEQKILMDATAYTSSLILNLKRATSAAAGTPIDFSGSTNFKYISFHNLYTCIQKLNKRWSDQAIQVNIHHTIFEWILIRCMVLNMKRWKIFAPISLGICTPVLFANWVAVNNYIWWIVTRCCIW